MDQGGYDNKKEDESSDSVEQSTVVSRAVDSNSNSNNDYYWSTSPYFLEILIPIISSFLLLRRRDLFGRLLLNLDKNCFSALCPSLSKREHLLKWAQRGIMPSWMPCPMNISLTLDDVWKDGSLLCTLINSAVPGACPNPHRHRNKPPTHGQALAYKYFGLAPIFATEDFDQDLSGNLEFLFFMYLTQLRTNISQFSTIDPFDVNYTSSYIARGMGLVTGEQYKKCVFYLYPNTSETDTGVLVTIKGPYHAYGCISLPPFYIFKTSSWGNRKKQVFYIEEDIQKLTVVKTQSEKHLFRSITSAIIPFLKNAHRSPVTSKIRIEANKEPDRIKLTYIPQHPGVHIMCIVTDGCHLQGSPFNVSISESDVEEIPVTKTELTCDLIPEKSKPTKSPLSTNRYFNNKKSTCVEQNLFERYNRINYQKFCKKFELLRSSFDERQEFSLDSLEDEEFFTNNEVKFLKRNPKACERFTDSIQRVIKMIKHNEGNWIEERIMTKAICDGTNTFNDQQQENDNENGKMGYFEEKNATKQLGGITIIKLKKNPTTEFVLTAPKRTRKRQNDDTICTEMDKELIKSYKCSAEYDELIKNIQEDINSVNQNVKVKELPVADDDIRSQKNNFNIIFEHQDSNEKSKLNAKVAKIDKAENNSFFTITGTEFEDDGNITVRSKKTITSESNNTSPNFSAECEVDKTKNAITEQSGGTKKEISANKNMFTNEKTIKNFTDNNGILREKFNGKTSEAKRILEGDQFNFNNKNRQHPNVAVVENFKGIDVWQNRADGGKILEKDEKINSVKMKIFTYSTQPENKLKIDHQQENNNHHNNHVTKGQKFSLVKKRKNIFDSKCEDTPKEISIHQDVTEIPLINVNFLRNRFDSIQENHKITKPESNTHPKSKDNIILPFGGESVVNRFPGHSPLLETYFGDSSSVTGTNKNLGKERAGELKKQEPTLTPTAQEKICNAIESTVHSKQGPSPGIINENFVRSSEKLSKDKDNVLNYIDCKSKLPALNLNENMSTKLEDKIIISSTKNNFDSLLERGNSLIDGGEEQEEKYKNNSAKTVLEKKSATNNLESLDHLIDKVDNLIDNIELEEKSARDHKHRKSNDIRVETRNLGNDLDFLMRKVNKLIDVSEAEEKPKEFVPISTRKYAECQQKDTIVTDKTSVTEDQIINVEILNKEEENLRQHFSVLTMVQKFENSSTPPTENKELIIGRTDDKSISYLEKLNRFMSIDNISEKCPNGHLVNQQVSVQKQELYENDNLNSSSNATKSCKSAPATTTPRKFLNLATKSQSYPSYDDLSDEFLDLTQNRNPQNKLTITTYIENGPEEVNENTFLENRNNNKRTSTVYIVTESEDTEIRRNVYTHSCLSPTKEKIREIQTADEQRTEDPLTTDKKEFDTIHQNHPASFSSIIKKSHNGEEEIFPDVSGFLKENNRQHPHVDYPKDFSVSRRVSRIESLQSLLAQNNMYVTSQIHRSHPNIYFGESPKRKERTHKPWRKLKSFDATLLTAASSEARNDTNTSTYNANDDKCTKFQIKEEKVPDVGATEGKRTSRIIKSSETQQAERRSQEAASNCQINQKGLQSQLSLAHPDGFPSVRDLRSKFEKTAESIATDKNSKSRGRTRSLDPDKCYYLDSSEENSTSLKYFSPLVNSTHPIDSNRESNIIKPLKHAKNILPSIEVKRNKNQSESTLTQREDRVMETSQPHVLKSTSQHHFNGGCKQGTTSPPQYSFIKTPGETNSIRSEKKTRQVEVEHNKGKTPERGDDASSCENLDEDFEMVDVKNIMKSQFTKARIFFKELENSHHNLSKIRKSIKKKRKNSEGNCCLPKVSEKFPLRNIYKDVVGHKRGSFKGAANRVGVANAMASVPVHQYFDPDATETIPSLDIFNQNNRAKLKNKWKCFFLLDYLP